MVTHSATILFLLKRVDCNDGVASYCETIIRGLVGRGDRVVIVSGPVTELYGSSERRRAIESLVLEWVVINNLSPRKLSVSSLRTVFGLIKTHAVDVLSPQGLALLPFSFLISSIARRPVVANYHPSMVGNSAKEVSTRRSGKIKFLLRSLFRVLKPAKVIANSRDNYDFFLNDCGIREDRLAYIVNGVDTTEYRPPTVDELVQARMEYSIPANTLVCVLPGRLNYVKGHDIAVDAIRSLREKKPEIKIICLFLGAGDQEAEIKDYTFLDDQDRSNFRFLGFLSGSAAIRKVYWAADIVLLPSRFEGSPIALAEAMSCGCVPIRTPAGGWQDQIIDGENGFIVPHNDPKSLAERIIDLTDSSRRVIMRNRAISFAATKFSQQKMIEATSNLYRSCLG